MTDKPKSSLYLRVVSGVILAPVALFCIMYGGIPFVAMVGVALGIACYEWVRMAKLAAHPLANAILGLVYIVLCFSSFIYLRLNFDGIAVGMTLSLLLGVWASDSGAYFAGKTIGGPKMAPSISPNKTWAGLFGGMAASIGVMFLYAYCLGPYLGDLIWSDYRLPEQFTAPVLLALGIAITISGQIGDLLISREKRKVGVKDTGHLIPGHGGILDRIDALLLVSLVYLLGVKALGL